MVENPSGEFAIETEAGPLPAIASEVAGTYATFDAYRLRHQTAAWKGDRLLLVAFSVKNVDRLGQGNLSILREQKTSTLGLMSCALRVLLLSSLTP